MGLVGPRRDGAVPREAVVAERLEVGRRPAGLLLRGPPPVAAGDDPLLGTGDRDVGQAQLLALVELRHRLGEGGEVLGRPPGHRREVAGVSPQRERHDGAAAEPRAAASAGREDLGREVGEHDHRPLEALGLVHRQQLHAAGLAWCGLVEPTVELFRRAQVAQERSQPRLAVEIDERRSCVEETPEAVRRPGAGHPYLDVESEPADDPVDEVEQRLADMPPQLADLGRQRPEALPSLFAVGQASEGGQGVGQRHDVGGVNALDGVVELAFEVELLGRVRGLVDGVLGRVGVGQPGTHELLGPPAEQREVTRPDAPTRTGEQAHQRGVGGRVVDDVERRDDVGHLGELRADRRGPPPRRGSRATSGTREAGRSRGAPAPAPRCPAGDARRRSRHRPAPPPK